MKKLVLVTQRSENLVEVLCEHSVKLTIPSEYSVTTENVEGLTGKLYHLHGTFNDTLTMHVRNTNEFYTFRL